MVLPRFAQAASGTFVHASGKFFETGVLALGLGVIMRKMEAVKILAGALGLMWLMMTGTLQAPPGPLPLVQSKETPPTRARSEAKTAVAAEAVDFWGPGS